MVVLSLLETKMPNNIIFRQSVTSGKKRKYQRVNNQVGIS